MLRFHAKLLEEHGGLAGPANNDALEATLARPIHLHGYENANPFALAASYGYGFARNHCFPDGNKRIALVAISVFLKMNGYTLPAPEFEAVEVITSLASGDLSETELAAWVEANSQKVPPAPDLKLTR
ncbi:MAG: type II toxin-antitoxin system death-on-curing family toxin [Gammaproteobacteria bacterium]|nr:type II toxin-antitoxin system death-on-curing family toxin [Gammaproteobacteria bacterium]